MTTTYIIWARKRLHDRVYLFGNPYLWPVVERTKYLEFTEPSLRMRLLGIMERRGDLEFPARFRIMRTQTYGEKPHWHMVGVLELVAPNQPLRVVKGSPHIRGLVFGREKAKGFDMWFKGQASGRAPYRGPVDRTPIV